MTEHNRSFTYLYDKTFLKIQGWKWNLGPKLAVCSECWATPLKRTQEEPHIKNIQLWGVSKLWLTGIVYNKTPTLSRYIIRIIICFFRVAMQQPLHRSQCLQIMQEHKPPCMIFISSLPLLEVMGRPSGYHYPNAITLGLVLDQISDQKLFVIVFILFIKRFVSLGRY